MHLMLDLETWSTRPTAAVAQIALVPFEFRARGRVYNESVFNKFVLLQDGMGALDQGTLSFWLGQGDKARSMLVQGLQNDGVPLLDALTSLMTWPAETGIPGFESWADVDGLWSNGAAFDIPILENAFNMCGLPAPWHYRSARCCRTVTALKGDVTVDTTGMVEHYAPDDCLCQVMKLQKQLFP